MSAIGACRQLESLFITGIVSWECDFSPLRRLTKLRFFELNGQWLVAGLAHALRELPLLDEIKIGLAFMSSDERHRDFLRVLCSDHAGLHHHHPHVHLPSHSHVRSLHAYWTLTQEEVAWLSRLPSLTSLQVRMSEGCSDVLPSLKLRELILSSPPSVLLSAVSRMSTLTRLQLSKCSLSAEIGMELMRGLRCLQTLELYEADIIGGQLGLLKEATNLRSLALTSCRGMSEDSLLVLCDTSTQTLALRRSVRLGGWAERCLRHSLQRFQYVPPQQ